MRKTMEKHIVDLEISERLFAASCLVGGATETIARRGIVGVLIAAYGHL